MKTNNSVIRVVKFPKSLDALRNRCNRFKLWMSWFYCYQYDQTDRPTMQTLIKLLRKSCLIRIYILCIILLSCLGNRLLLKTLWEIENLFIMSKCSFFHTKLGKWTHRCCHRQAAMFIRPHFRLSWDLNLKASDIYHQLLCHDTPILNGTVRNSQNVPLRSRLKYMW